MRIYFKHAYVPSQDMYAYPTIIAYVPFLGLYSGGRRKSVGKARWVAVAWLAAQADFALPGRSLERSGAAVGEHLQPHGGCGCTSNNEIYGKSDLVLWPNAIARITLACFAHC